MPRRLSLDGADGDRVLVQINLPAELKRRAAELAGDRCEGNLSLFIRTLIREEWDRRHPRRRHPRE
jgi:hypothetical protein